MVDGKIQLWRLTLLCLGLALVVMAGCETKAPEPVVIENVFFKQLAPNQTTAAVYMKITNNSEVMQPINYIHSPIAEHIEIHHTIYNEGMMQMRQVNRLSLAPGETQMLEPGGYHLMMFGIYDNLPAGETFEITFELETGLVITTQGVVKPHG